MRHYSGDGVDDLDNGLKNGRGIKRAMNPKMMGRFNGPNGAAVTPDNRSRPYPNVRNGNRSVAGGGFGNGAGFGNGGGALPSLMGNNYPGNGFGAGGDMMIPPAQNFFNNGAGAPGNFMRSQNEQFEK